MEGPTLNPTLRSRFFGLPAQERLSGQSIVIIRLTKIVAKLEFFRQIVGGKRSIFKVVQTD